MLNTSPSQYQVHKKFCPRKWWFRYVCKLEEPKKPFQGLGSAFHKVIETFLKADATGRDPATGKPVELYDSEMLAEFKLLPQDLELIQKLIPEAIENGTLYRPGGDYAVEREYFWDIPGGRAREHGYTDLLEADCVSDHKTTSASRWALSREDLKFDLQMRAYALELTRVHVLQGHEPPDEIRLRHNIYVTKDRPRTFFRETSVFREDLKEHEETIQEIIGEMVALIPVRMADWESIPNSPRPNTDACNAYGGCPYRGICAKGERPDQYKLRIENSKKTPQELAEEGRTVRKLSLGNLLGNPAPAAPTKPQPAVPFTQVAAIVPAAPAAPAAAPTKPQQPPAPWYVAGCAACSANEFPGFSSKLTPCRVCDNKTAQAGGRPSSDFQITQTDVGPVVVDVYGGREETTVDVAATAAATAAAPDFNAAELAAAITEANAEEASGDHGDQPHAPGFAADNLDLGDEPVKRPRGRKPGSKNKPKGESPTTALGIMLKGDEEGDSDELLKSICDRLDMLTRAVQGLQSAVAPGLIAARQADEALGFHLAIGCVPARHAMLVELSEFLKPWKEQICKHKNVSSFFKLNAFERRDLLCGAMEEAVQSLPAGTWIICPREFGADMTPVLEVLRELAVQVVE